MKETKIYFNTYILYLFITYNLLITYYHIFFSCCDHLEKFLFLSLRDYIGN